MPLVDLDDPEELRARWSALAAVAHATGFDRRWYADADGYHHQDETASVLRMARLRDGRAVLWGFHTQHSRTGGEDLLAGSPEWIGQPEVRQRQAAGELGFVYGAFNGTWARASYPGDPWQPVDDGFAPIGQWITSDEAAADEMIEWVAGWADYLGGLDELRPYGVALIRGALGPGITAETLGAFFAPFRIDPRSPLQPDLAAGVAAADDFTRNVAEPANFPEDPDTAEVSVVEAPVIGDNLPAEDEESYVVPPGISPFTGQPIDSPPAGMGQPQASLPSAQPARSDDDYGVTTKKQGWLRRRKSDTPPDPTADPTAAATGHGAPAHGVPGVGVPRTGAPGTGAPGVPGVGVPGTGVPGTGVPGIGVPGVGGFVPGAAGAGGSGIGPGGPAPGTYLPDNVPTSGLPTAHPAYDPILPSSEPPRVGGGRYEGEDFYNSLFADTPATAAPTADQDWETAEQPAWTTDEATSEYNPFAEETAPHPSTEWTGPAWINGQWVEDPTTHQAPPNSPFAPSTSPTDHPQAPPTNSPLAPAPGTPGTADAPSALAHGAAGTADAPFASAPPAGTADSPSAPASNDAPPTDVPFTQPTHPASAPTTPLTPLAQQTPGATDSPFAPVGAEQADASFGPADGLDDDAPTAEIPAVPDPDLATGDEEPASFTGPSPFAPVAHTDPAPLDHHLAPAQPSTAQQASPEEPHAAHPSDPPTAYPATAASAPQATYPEASAPQAAYSEASAPQAAYSEASAPQAAYPEASAPQAAHPVGSAPQETYPTASAPHTTSPDGGTPHTAHPANTSDTAYAGADASGAAHPGASTSGTAYAGPAGSHPAYAGAAELQATYPGASDAGATDSDAGEPHAAQSAAVQAEGERTGEYRTADGPDAYSVDSQSREFAAGGEGLRADSRSEQSAADLGSAGARAGTTASAEESADLRTDVAAEAGVDADDQTAEIPAILDDPAAEESSDVPRAGQTSSAPGVGQVSGARGSEQAVGWGTGGRGVSADAAAYAAEVAARGDRRMEPSEVQAQVEPHPEPWPQPQPQPGPWPQPEPHPAPWPEPNPPHPEPTPRPVPGPEPTPGPGPSPVPGPGPTPGPEPFPGPEPTPRPIPNPEPEPGPEPLPEPEPQPFPEPEPEPLPEPEPEPMPEPMPEPEPEPAPEPEPEPWPDPYPDPERIPKPEPGVDQEPAPARTLAPQLHPTHAPVGELQAEHSGVDREARWNGESDAAHLDDDTPTGAIPVVEDDEPTGLIEAISFEESAAGGLGAAAAGGLGAVLGGGAAAGMVVAGLGLVGTGAPRVVPEPGSLEEAMRSEVERPRPRPKESEAVRALGAWCRARTAVVPSGFTIQVQVLDPNAPSYRFDLEPPEVDDPEFAADKLSDLLADLWLTEAQGEQGGWLFARIDAAGRTVRIDRWYDQVPDWWDNPVEERLDVDGLVRRLYDRGPEWQPSYLEKLYTSAG